jgi:hypothetical protein
MVMRSGGEPDRRHARKDVETCHLLGNPNATSTLLNRQR